MVGGKNGNNVGDGWRPRTNESKTLLLHRVGNMLHGDSRTSRCPLDGRKLKSTIYHVHHTLLRMQDTRGLRRAVHDGFARATMLFRRCLQVS